MIINPVPENFLAAGWLVPGLSSRVEREYPQQSADGLSDYILKLQICNFNRVVKAYPGHMQVADSAGKIAATIYFNVYHAHALAKEDVQAIEACMSPVVTDTPGLFAVATRIDSDMPRMLPTADVTSWLEDVLPRVITEHTSGTSICITGFLKSTFEAPETSKSIVLSLHSSTPNEIWF